MDISDLLSKIDWKHPITIIVIVAMLVVAGYYLMSPYQKCVRSQEYLNLEGYNLESYCLHQTSW